MDRSLWHMMAVLFGLTLLVRALTALTLEHAGYFDSFYYYHIAQSMVAGEGLTESIIWNYLDDPQAMPRPSNQYWMPMTNFWAWLGLATLGGVLPAWRAAQVPFVLASALLPPLAAWLAWRGWGRRGWAWSAGLLTIFSGFYFTYWVVTDNYTPFALTVALALLGMWQGLQRGGSPAGSTAHSAVGARPGGGVASNVARDAQDSAVDYTNRTRWWAVAGLGVGLSHLTRVDGALLVPLVAGLLLWQHRPTTLPRLVAFLRDGSAAALGYLLVMAPWWLRNWLVVGTPFPGGGTQTIWMRHYNEIFSYDLALTPQYYVEWGLGPILASKVSGLLWSSLIILGSMQFFLAPFVLASLRAAVRRPLFRPFLLYTLLLLTAMPLVFTFPARRGSLLHSAAALMPWMMALAPYGIDRVVRALAARRPAWDAEQAATVLGAGFVGLAALITLYIYAGAVWLPPAPNAVTPPWNQRTMVYEQAEAWLRAQGVPSEERIFVVDPPRYYVTGQRPALVIPTEGPEVLARAAQDWGARWVLLDSAYSSEGYKVMYEEQREYAGWQPVATFPDPFGNEAVLFRFGE